MKQVAVLLGVLMALGCGDDTTTIVDAGMRDADGRDSGSDAQELPDVPETDSGPLDASGDVGARDAGADASTDVGLDGALDAALDAGADAALDASGDAGFGMSCAGACATTRLEARFAAVTEPFDVAYFGFNGDGTLHVEAYGGAADGCPEMGSPSPDRTLILGRLPAPMDRDEVTLTASLLDFEGTLTSAPFLSSPMAHVRGVAARLTPLESAFIRVDFDAMFEGGSVDGAIYATHCASLDE